MATLTQEPYEYLSITDSDGIRLIVLQPSPDKAVPVHCSIIHTTLCRAQEDIYEHYTALSYVWGDANDTASISVDGRFLQVTKNLECALRYLRDEKRVLRVWADGVCINQQDNGEKGKQVQQMGQLYEIAHHTVIFLGECDAATEAVLIKMLDCYKNGVMYPSSDEGIKALKQILARPWFYRIWILQELIMSHDPKLQLGSIRFPWRTLSHLQALFPDKDARYKGSDNFDPELCFPHPMKEKLGVISTSLTGAFEVVNQMNNAKCSFEKSRAESQYNAEEKPTEPPIPPRSNSYFGRKIAIKPKIEDQLLSVMEARRGCLASDSRDRVFAHLGLAKYIGITPDYEMTCQQLFKTFTECHISATNSLDIFSHIEDIELGKRMQGLPTWAPDWTRRQENPRYRLLTPQIYKYWCGARVRERGDGHRPKSSFGVNNFQTGSFTFKAFCMYSIKSLSRVLDTSSYEATPENKEDSPEARKPTETWFQDHFVLDLKAICTQSYDSLTLEYIVGFAMKELQLAKEEVGCLLDGRRLAIVEHTPPNICGEQSLLSAALVPASSSEGDFIYYPQWSTCQFVLRHAKPEYELPANGSRAVHMIGVCLPQIHLTDLEAGYVCDMNSLMKDEKAEGVELITIY
ncbi:HET-domain-containing protein [Stipitochalara longipes BDJ]|nr:HET-domain-containing protein [Stipitochalara longipes BDJ]